MIADEAGDVAYRMRLIEAERHIAQGKRRSVLTGELELCSGIEETQDYAWARISFDMLPWGDGPAAMHLVARVTGGTIDQAVREAVRAWQDPAMRSRRGQNGLIQITRFDREGMKPCGDADRLGRL